MFTDLFEMAYLNNALVHVLVMLISMLHVTETVLLSFGNSSGDTGLTDDGGSSSAISLSKPFLFFQDSYSTVYVS